jgi:hypothetical protein
MPTSYIVRWNPGGSIVGLETTGIIGQE